MIDLRGLTLVFAFSAVSLFGGDWESVGPGVDYREFEAKAPITYHVARISLANGKVRPIVSSEQDRGLTVTGFAARRDTLVAVNGDYFDPQMLPIGQTRGSCGEWKARSSQSPRKETVLMLSASTADVVEPPEQPVEAEGSDQIISGWPVLVRDCKALSEKLPGSPAFTRAPHARTAVGITADHKTLFLVVADGQKDGSAGVTLPDLAAFMQDKLHVCEAVNLDGGGSSAMAVKKKLVSSPTGGAERAVANHLGIVLASDYSGCVDSPNDISASTRTDRTVAWWKDVEEILGRRGTMNDGVFQATFLRSDLSLRFDGVDVAPQLALTSSLAITKSGSSFTLIGEFVLSEKEVRQFSAELKGDTFVLTPPHELLEGGTPSLMLLHVSARSSDPTAMAHAIRAALDETATPRAGANSSAATSWSSTNRRKLDSIIGSKGIVRGPVLQYAVKAGTSRSESSRAASALGAVSTIGLQPLDQPGMVAAAGELVLSPEAATTVRQSLEKNGFRITTAEQLPLSQQSRIANLHFWIRGDAAGVMTSIRHALDADTD